MTIVDGIELKLMDAKKTTPSHRENPRQWLLDLIRDLESQRFYGSLELNFQKGLIITAKKTETIKPN